MEVRPDFKDRVAALCAGIPPSSVSMLLKAILPKTVQPSMKSPMGPAFPTTGYRTREEQERIQAKSRLHRVGERTAAHEIAAKEADLQKRVRDKAGKFAELYGKLPEPPSKVPGTDLHKPKTKAPKGVRYLVLVPNAHNNHSPDTERHAMAQAATELEDSAPKGVQVVRGREYIEDRYDEVGHHGGQPGRVDFSWLQRMGYIAIYNEGE